MGEAHDQTLATPNRLDRLRFLFSVALPLWAQGILMRRPWVTRLAAVCDWDGAAIRFIQRLRRRYGESALVLWSVGRRHVLLLSVGDAQTVLAGTPEPFSPATREKRAALGHYEPRVSLVTRGPVRAVRRQFNDDLLESDRPCHALTGNFIAIVRHQALQLMASLRNGGELNWPMFTEAWYAAVRRLVFGDVARQDRMLTQQLSGLRTRANWVFLPARRALRERYYARLEGHVTRAEPGSLAAAIARQPVQRDAHPLDQITQWLFAFDGGAMTTFRALALFASHSSGGKIRRRRAGVGSR